MVDAPTARVVALQGVTVRKTAGCLHDGDTAAAFSCETIFFVFDLHHALGESTLDPIEIQTVKGD